jgi:methylated-DNA-[protein]-cysteine S-methyltransferase
MTSARPSGSGRGGRGTSASGFARRVLQAVRRIPPGAVATYGDIAALAGRPRAARAVGNLMRSGRLGEAPYHRVIAAGGRLGGYGGNEALKAALLRSEGLVVVGGRIRMFAQARWPRPARR